MLRNTCIYFIKPADYDSAKSEKILTSVSQNIQYENQTVHD